MNGTTNDGGALAGLVRELTAAGVPPERFGWLEDGTPWVEWGMSRWWVELRPEGLTRIDARHDTLHVYANMDELVKRIPSKFRIKAPVAPKEQGQNTNTVPVGQKREDEMSKEKELNVSALCQGLLKDLVRTRNTRALGLLVKAALHRRDELAGKEPEALVVKLERVAETKVRDRVADMLTRVATLTSKKDVSVFSGAAIAQRKLVRAKA